MMMKKVSLNLVSATVLLLFKHIDEYYVAIEILKSRDGRNFPTTDNLKDSDVK